ncbi:MAG: PilT/PilU family type 4a pilus ATPase [Candidatus Eremiobacteraeota bacterium]|nr:PilT/PilU family type 4a pilus ATPase [Candidatus Eremiobacteraeota bacterium]
MNERFSEIRFDDLVYKAHARAASDIHLVAGVRASIRVDGALEYVDGPVVTAEETSTLARRVLDERARSTLSGGGDATSTWSGSQNGVMRVHAFRADGNVALSIRLLPEAVPRLEALHLPPVVHGFVRKQRGLIVFAGPTGSGKSTSMAALIAEMNRTVARRVVTIEDPIEYRHPSDHCVIVQREVGHDVPSFSAAVIGALRADPDVIMIGEMRDEATIRSAMIAAETGHLVLTTLHTGDAVQTVDRIVDAFTGSEQSQIRAQLAGVLVAIVCQRLLPRASGNGRRVAAEVLIANDAVKATIREGRTHQLRNVMLTGRQLGMQTLEHHLTSLLSDRVIDETVASAASERRGELPESAIAH